jgi:hypothetical protein
VIVEHCSCSGNAFKQKLKSITRKLVLFNLKTATSPIKTPALYRPWCSPLGRGCSLKGTVGPVLVRLKVVWSERAKPREEPLSVFLNFPQPLPHLLKFEGAVENFKNHSGSSTRTDLSNNTIFSQSQSHATVPLKGQSHEMFQVISTVV